MRPSLDLRILQSSALDRLERLHLGIDDALTSPEELDRVEKDRLTSHSIVELYNLWFSFSRSVYLSSAFEARDGNGDRVALTLPKRCATVNDALTHAIHRVKPHVRPKASWSWSDEPSWGVVRILLECLDEIGASNHGTVSAGVSTGTSVFSQLPKVRHFYAHRGEGTNRKIARTFTPYLMPANLHPSDALLRPAQMKGKPRPQPLLLDWVDDVRNAVSLMI
jgi:hypothetical protein